MRPTKHHTAQQATIKVSRSKVSRSKVLLSMITVAALGLAACGSDAADPVADTTVAADEAVTDTAPADAPEETTAAEVTETTVAATTETTAAAAETTVAVAAAAEECADLKPVKLQLQWVTQAQFAGYFAALEQGFYKAQCLDVTILEGAVDIVPQTQLAAGAADYAIAWVPKALASREQGANVVNVAQIFERSATLQVSWADSGIKTAADLKGKKVGNWGFGNEFELFAGMTKGGLDPAKDVTLVQQSFDMQALLKREIDASQAMIYNEYAQLLETKNPETGELYKAEDFNVINWETEGTAMLQDAIWANGDKLSDAAYADQTQRFVNASIQGWVFCRDNAAKCVDIVVAKGSKLGKSHQAWQMNEVNKLLWPSANGIGMINQAQWDQTVKLAAETKNAEGATVLTKPVDAAAFSNDFVKKSHEAWKAAGVDINGSSYAAETITLNENGE
jgi:NitT/TauT family transport system substrate-binding protein